jgi:Rho GTPase-activating protein 1
MRVVLADLLHDVSLRSNINRMDAYNLAIVFAPNLVKSINPMRDVQMCAIPGGPSMDPHAAPSPPKDKKSTLGMVIKCCIERYFEVFDEVQDRTEAVPPSDAALAQSSRRSNHDIGEFLSTDDEMDDVMLVMPNQSSIEPHPSLAHSSRLPPSAWSSQNVDAAHLPYQTRQSRHQRIASGGGTSHHDMSASPTQSPSLIGLGVRSMATGGTPAPFPSVGKSRSVVSVEKDSGPLTAAGMRRGSIRLGTGTSKGTVGKSAGATVEALGITASGFFAPPGAATKSRNGNSVM